ncbi:hypothetical protein E3N88_14338 [Mikania micrantha]|uniref:Protein kinase domain-containing protein n=1 Tax=Mikania micrantha TaxID=192012 RepID=A0A5N6P2E7_9ASTR|nr:hypothetical protein E3N88_14338 [Mikania micrantha]
MELTAAARLAYQNGTLNKLIDPKIKEADENILILNEGVNQVSLDKFSDIAYKCVAESQNDRPTIEDVVKELKEALYYQENNKDKLHISLEVIKLGTDNFSDCKCIGEGRYWKQYVGEIVHANMHITVVAKRWDNNYVSKYDISRGYLTKESDIYSFGVVIKEMFQGIPARPDRIPIYESSYKRREILQHQDAFEGIEEQIDPKTFKTFADIAGLCLDHRRYRPDATRVITELEKALEFQEDYEKWEPRLPVDYQKIIQMSKTPELYQSIEMRDMFLKGILLQDGKLFSIGTNGERNEMMSARKFSYRNHRSHKWRSADGSRFPKVAEITDISNLKIQIKMKKEFISPSVKHKVYLIFRVCGPRKSQAKRMYVNLKYKTGNETLHAYFATWREDGWMMIELFQSLNHKKDTDFEVLLESFSRCYCASSSIYIEGIEFQAIDNVNHEETKGFKEVQKVDLNTEKVNKQHIEEQEMILSAKKVVYTSLNPDRFDGRISQRHQVYHDSIIFRGAIEFLRHHVFRIRCKIQRQMLSANTKNVCYLVFKLSEKCHGLHGPVIVRDLFHQKETRILYFRSPNPSNIHDSDWIPEKREDGWLEVIIWIFNSDYELKSDHLFVNLKLVTYEGTMSGLIVRGIEFRPI